MPAATINLDSLQAAVCRGVVEGNREIITALTEGRDDRHSLRNKIQGVADKNFELDSEIRLLKGFMVTLVGNGDGSSGMVPRLERDMKTMGEDISQLSSDMRLVNEKVDGMSGDIKTLLQKTEANDEFRWGWKGVAAAISVIVGLLSIIGFLLARGFHL